MLIWSVIRWESRSFHVCYLTFNSKFVRRKKSKSCLKKGKIRIFDIKRGLNFCKSHEGKRICFDGKLFLFLVCLFPQISHDKKALRSK